MCRSIVDSNVVQSKRAPNIIFLKRKKRAEALTNQSWSTIGCFSAAKERPPFGEGEANGADRAVGTNTSA